MEGLFAWAVQAVVLLVGVFTAAVVIVIPIIVFAVLLLWAVLASVWSHFFPSSADRLRRARVRAHIWEVHQELTHPELKEDPDGQHRESHRTRSNLSHNHQGPI